MLKVNGRMLVFAKKRLYCLIPCFLFFLVAPSLSARAPFHPFEISNRLRFNLGLGLAFDYFSLGSDTLGPLQAGLEENAISDTFQASQAIEDQSLLALSSGSISQDLGGCPDTLYYLGQETSRDIPGFGTITVPAQQIQLDGVGCSASNGSGDGKSLNSVDLDFGLEYDLFPWLFIRTGFSAGFVLPHDYSFRFAYEAEGTLTDVAGLAPDVLTNLPITVSSDTTTTLTISFYQFRVPLLLGFNLLQFKYASFYVGTGVVYLHTSYRRAISSEGTATVASSSTGTELLSQSYEPVENVFTRNGIGFLVFTGGRVTLLHGLGMYAEIRWLVAGGSGTLEGTSGLPGAGVDHASNSSGARVIDNVAPGSIPRALQSTENPTGAIRTGGLSTGFNARVFIGLNYTFDFGKSPQS